METVSNATLTTGAMDTETSTPLPCGDEYFMYTLALCGITILALEVLFCPTATLLRVDKLKDVSGGGSFIIVAVLSFLFNLHQQPGPFHWRPVLVTACVCAWALRLAAYLLFRHIFMGQDKYTIGQPPTCCRHVGYWCFQAVWVFVVSLPVMAINSSTQHHVYTMWTPMDIAGTTVFGVGFMFELIADQQKLNSKRNPLNHSKWCTFGFWKWSRHPNYLFEMVTWWGMFILSIQTANSALQLIGVLSPLFVTVILLFISGIPVVEAAADGKYGKLSDYRKYKRHTSVLLPMHPWLYKRFPVCIKRTIFLDFPMYNFLPDDDMDKESETDLQTVIPTPL